MFAAQVRGAERADEQGAPVELTGDPLARFASSAHLRRVGQRLPVARGRCRAGVVCDRVDYVVWGERRPAGRSSVHEAGGLRRCVLPAGRQNRLSSTGGTGSPGRRLRRAARTVGPGAGFVEAARRGRHEHLRLERRRRRTRVTDLLSGRLGLAQAARRSEGSATRPGQQSPPRAPVTGSDSSRAWPATLRHLQRGWLPPQVPPTRP